MDEVEYVHTPYKYQTPESESFYLQQVKRGWLFNRYQYWRSSEFNQKREDRHPNWLAKTLAIVLFPVSVVMTGAPEAWRDTIGFLWDRKRGSFVSNGWWTE